MHPSVELEEGDERDVGDVCVDQGRRLSTVTINIHNTI